MARITPQQRRQFGLPNPSADEAPAHTPRLSNRHAAALGGVSPEGHVWRGGAEGLVSGRRSTLKNGALPTKAPAITQILANEGMIDQGSADVNQGALFDAQPLTRNFGEQLEESGLPSEPPPGAGAGFLTGVQATPTEAERGTRKKVAFERDGKTWETEMSAERARKVETLRKNEDFMPDEVRGRSMEYMSDAYESRLSSVDENPGWYEEYSPEQVEQFSQKNNTPYPESSLSIAQMSPQMAWSEPATGTLKGTQAFPTGREGQLSFDEAPGDFKTPQTGPSYSNEGEAKRKRLPETAASGPEKFTNVEHTQMVADSMQDLRASGRSAQAADVERETARRRAAGEPTPNQSNTQVGKAAAALSGEQDPSEPLHPNVTKSVKVPNFFASLQRGRPEQAAQVYGLTAYTPDTHDARAMGATDSFTGGGKKADLYNDWFGKPTVGGYSGAPVAQMMGRRGGLRQGMGPSTAQETAWVGQREGRYLGHEQKITELQETSGAPEVDPRATRRRRR